MTFQRVDVYLNEPIEIDELIKLANQSNQQVKSALVIRAAKTTIILIFGNKKQVGRSKHNNKRRNEQCYVLIKKGHIKGEKHIAPMDFAEYLRKSGVSENSKVYYGRFLGKGLHERYCYISKSR